MSTAREVALEVLPHFRKAVLAGHVYTYGHYAAAIGRDSATESMVIGQAMHAIGAACVVCLVPVAPLFFVERSDGGWKGVFEADPSEFTHVLPHYDLLYVTAREYACKSRDFERLEHALRVVLPKHLGPGQLSPHDIWHVVLCVKGKDGTTIFERALSKYRELCAEAQSARRGT